MRFISLSVLSLSALSGCVFDVPVALSIPATPLDLDAARTAFESHLCADAGSDACAVLDSLDRADGTAETPTALPPTFPPNIDVAVLSKNVDVQRWFGDQQENPEVTAALSLSRIVPLQLPDSVDATMISDLKVDAAVVRLESNTLTIDLPRFELYAGNGYDTDENGVVVGAHDEGSGEFIAVTDSADGGPIFFADGGVAALRDALVGDEPWIELRARDPLSLRPQDEALLRPGGSANVSLDLRIQVPVALRAKPVIATGDTSTTIQ